MAEMVGRKDVRCRRDVFRIFDTNPKKSLDKTSHYPAAKATADPFIDVTFCDRAQLLQIFGNMLPHDWVLCSRHPLLNPFNDIRGEVNGVSLWDDLWIRLRGWFNGGLCHDSGHSSILHHQAGNCLTMPSVQEIRGRRLDQGIHGTHSVDGYWV